MNNCNFDMSGNFLRHIYGAATIRPRSPWPSGVQQKNLLLFNQTRYVPANWTAGLWASGMDSTGFAYVPTACRASLAGCRYHVHYHPCGGSFRFVGLNYMLYNGLAAYAESSKIVILHPQASKHGIYGGNCWDWCGETSLDFDTRGGVQLNTVLNTLADIATIVREHANDTV